MTKQDSIRIEGYTPDEILSLPDEAVDALALTGSPIVFQAGTAEVLGRIEVRDDTLHVEFAHIDGGGEGVLQALTSIATRLARKRELTWIEWVVHATRCATPNERLRRVMLRRGFDIRTTPAQGDVFFRRSRPDQ